MITLIMIILFTGLKIPGSELIRRHQSHSISALYANRTLQWANSCFYQQLAGNWMGNEREKVQEASGYRRLATRVEAFLQLTKCPDYQSSSIYLLNAYYCFDQEFIPLGPASRIRVVFSPTSRTILLLPNLNIVVPNAPPEPLDLDARLVMLALLDTVYLKLTIAVEKYIEVVKGKRPGAPIDLWHEHKSASENSKSVLCSNVRPKAEGIKWKEGIETGVNVP